MARLFARVTLAVWFVVLSLHSIAARDLTFEDRVRAQEAIERVYFSHLQGETRSFEQVVPRATLERKVTTYLEQSAALEKIWHTPVTPTMLRRELERMAASTQMPARLQELFASLGNDPLLVAECLARPMLVDRMSRSFFNGDDSIHAAERAEIDGLRDALTRRAASALTSDPRRREVEVALGDPEAADSGGKLLDPTAYARLRGSLPARTGEVSEVADETGAFVVRQLLEEKPGSIRFATYTVPKTTWEEWWREASRALDPGSVRALAPALDRLPAPARASSCLPDDTWANDTVNARPRPRTFHTAVWTGSEMIVWGGNLPGLGLGVGTGGRYDPATDTWADVSTVGAPSARWRHTAVWTGTEMIVWGGYGDYNPLLQHGARYEPASNTWKPMTDVGEPEYRNMHTAIWTGSRMVVYGGWGAGALPTGGQYDPQTDTWTPVSTVGAPEGRAQHTAIWTGSRMIVWGGINEGPLDSGGQYDPLSDTWTSVTALGAPSARGDHTAVWTGSEMIVWGGADSSTVRDDGGRYDPSADRWTAVSKTGAPRGRSQHTAVWTGSKMFVWGSVSRLGGLYDPTTDSWTDLPVAGTPRPGTGIRAVWTGSLVLAWGGEEFYGSFGSRYDPATNRWTRMSEGTSPKGKQSGTGAIWTGTHMIVWGGDAYVYDLSNEGGMWDPATGNWSPTSLSNAPTPRNVTNLVWTGREMIVWGGSGEYGPARGGGVYDPATDTWMKIARRGAANPTTVSRTVWSGTRMIAASSSGSGSYDPRTNRWTAIANPGASGPLVWTGTRALLVSDGGYAASYDPQADTWTPIANPYAAKSVSGQLVWTGKEMIVWGGGFSAGYGLGYRYSPETDTWTPMSNFLAARANHTAIWTGDRLIVWGGSDEVGHVYVEGGGRYDPETDSWTYVTTVDAASRRFGHVAVWTGSEMVVWGATPEADGGVYATADGACSPP